jgi:hypothetical protein
MVLPYFFRNARPIAADMQRQVDGTAGDGFAALHTVQDTPRPCVGGVFRTVQGAHF